MPDPMSQLPPSPPPADLVEDGTLAFPAAISQQVFWYLELLQAGVTAFNVPLRFRLTGPLDVGVLERTMNTIVARHEALRTHFEEDGGELLQIVSPALALKLGVIDLSGQPPERVELEADRLAGIEARRPFQLATGPLIRIELLRLGAEIHHLHVTVHHAIFDGLSMTVLAGEMARIYQSYALGHRCPLDPLPIQYGDFSVWQQDFLESPAMADQLAYWKQALAGMTELDLSTDFPRPAVKSWQGDITSVLLPTGLTDRLQAIAARHGSTLFHLQLAAFQILLGRYTGSTDIAVGTPVTGRTREELEPLIGVFINSLILRSDLSGNPTFGEFLLQVRDTTLNALDNQDLPFECLVRELRPERDAGRNPFFQVNFNHYRSIAPAGTFGGVSLAAMPSLSPGTIFDLHFFLVEREEGWRASCDFSTDLFSRASADRMLGHFQHLLEDIAAHPEQPIDALEILTPSEKLALTSWSGAVAAYPREATIGGLFLETALRHPQRVALTCGSRTLTYFQLHSESTQLARQLLEQGLAPGELVAISARPSPEMVVGFLAILLAGGCCVPIDPTDPQERFALLLEESGAKLGLATVGCEVCYPLDWAGKIVPIHTTGKAGGPVTLRDISVTAEHPAQLLVTSGSTGRPKGVLLTHRGVIRLVRNPAFLEIGPDDVFLQAAPVSFDASLFEIWGPLLNGGRLVLMPDGPGLDAIASSVRDHGITVLWLTSGLFQLLMDEHPAALKGLRTLLIGGDVLSIPHVRKALDSLPGTRLINGYGPTENSIFTTCHPITPADLDKPSIPIGKPVPNTTVHLLDAALRPVPVGIPGELFTGGDGLALGYHGAPELTAEKFILHPEHGRLYRTGDRCRYAADGVIEFLGRTDHQVKVRGFRIELGEIESLLASHPQIRQAKAAVRGASAESRRILAWVVTADGAAVTESGLTDFLATRLPAFMRPDAIAVIDAFPLTANGKIQLATLPDPTQRTVPRTAKIPAPPQGKIEVRLAAIWSGLLGISGIDRDDDFFDLGGHSLMALRMFSRINREFQCSLSLATLLGHPTVSALATVLAPALLQASAAQKGNIVTLAKGGAEPPLFCIHGGDGGVLFYRGLASLMSPEIPVHAIESLELGNSGPIEPTSIEETAAAYLRCLLALQPAGPFRLAGYSFGGVVAHAMACELVRRGQEVDFLGLFDTHNPTAPARTYRLPERLQVFWRQSAGLPLLDRIALVRRRFREGDQTHRRVRAELEAAQAAGPAAAYSDLRRVQVREENWRAMQDYRPAVFPGRITLFRTTVSSDKVERPADYGWSGLAAGGLKIVSVSGEHLTLFAPENIGSLASALTASLPPPTRAS